MAKRQHIGNLGDMLSDETIAAIADGMPEPVSEHPGWGEMRKVYERSREPGGGPRTCDSCHETVERDANGYWVGDDETSDCPVSPEGHTVDGAPQ